MRTYANKRSPSKKNDSFLNSNIQRSAKSSVFQNSHLNNVFKTDFSQLSVYPSESDQQQAAKSRAEDNHTSIQPMAGPVSDGVSNKPELPPGEFNEEEMALPEAPTTTAPATTATNTTTPATTPAPGPAQQPQPAPASARTVIRGPREMWFFNNETPPNYTVASRLSSNKAGGTFQWSTSAQLTLSSATDARPTVTTAAASAPPGRDAWIRLRHTDAGGTRTAASYRLTILEPDSLNHLGADVDNAVAGLGYESEIHYSILDQFGTVLPRNVPLNEQWTGAAVIDFPGGNWTRPPDCGATGVCGASFNPADFHDRVTGEGDAGAIPAPVAPTHAQAAVAAEHWPGDWRIGSSIRGNGSLVASVTWQRNRGHARHT